MNGKRTYSKSVVNDLALYHSEEQAKGYLYFWWKKYEMMMEQKVEMNAAVRRTSAIFRKAVSGYSADGR